MKAIGAVATTNAVATARAVAGVTWTRLPDDIDVAAVYGSGLFPSAAREAKEFLRFLEGPDGRSIFERFGFQ
jgi:ABC-type molybdate transport system substrate-binding protein